VRKEDRRTGFKKFMEGVNRLLADENFREVLQELDEEGEEALGLLELDPAAFLKHRGVAIPEDFRISVVERAQQAPKGQRTRVCYCLEICWWRWCVSICFCITRTIAR
jgi:hypothetical protein